MVVKTESDETLPRGIQGGHVVSADGDAPSLTRLPITSRPDNKAYVTRTSTDHSDRHSMIKIARRT